MLSQFFYGINCTYKTQDFASMHVFILPSLWQTINKPRCALASQYVSLFLLQQSPYSLNFSVLTSFVLKATWIWHQFFFFPQWEISNLWSMLWHIWHKMLKQERQGFVGMHQNRCQQLANAVLLDLPSIMITSWLIQLLPICFGLLLWSWTLHARLRSREITTLLSHHTALLSVWISV